MWDAVGIYLAYLGKKLVIGVKVVPTWVNLYPSSPGKVDVVTIRVFRRPTAHFAPTLPSLGAKDTENPT